MKIVLLYSYALASLLVRGTKGQQQANQTRPFVRSNTTLTNQQGSRLRKLKPFNKKCLAVIVDIEHSSGEGTENQRLSCETEGGIILDFQGVDKGWLSDEIEFGGLKSGETILEMPPDAMFDPSSQEIVLPQAAAIGYDHSKGIVEFDKSNGIEPGGGNRKLAVQGTKSVLVVNVVASNGGTSFSDAELSDSIFGTYGDPVNLRNQYYACSHGQLLFNPTTSRNGRSAYIRNGVVTIRVSTATSQGDVAMRNAVSAQLNYEFSVSSPNQLANYVMYCLPRGTMSDIAYAFVNHWQSVYSNDWCTYVTTQMHELGHNLGLDHASEGSEEYGDISGVMGSGTEEDDNRMCFNAGKTYQLGWFDSQTLTVEQSTISTAKTYSLGSTVRAPGSTPEPKIIKINRGSTYDLFMTFNWAVGANSGTKEGRNQVNIVYQEGTGRSWLATKLSAGWSSTFNNYFATGSSLKVTVLSISTSTGVASVRLEVV